MSRQWNSAQKLLNSDCKIFRSRDGRAEFLKVIQILVIEAIQDFTSDDGIQSR